MEEKQRNKRYVLRKLFFASLYLSTFTFGISESRTNIRFCCTFIKKDAILKTVKACLIL